MPSRAARRNCCILFQDRMWVNTFDRRCKVEPQHREHTSACTGIFSEEKHTLTIGVLNNSANHCKLFAPSRERPFASWSDQWKHLNARRPYLPLSLTIRSA